jgi:FkbM family methyltransferase
MRSILFRYHAWSQRRRDARERREVLSRASLILEDDYHVRFVLSPGDRHRVLQLVYRNFDRAEFRAISQLVNEWDVAFDVGANTGEYSVLLSRQCGATGRVWAFEPVPDTYWRLRETLALNRCGNTTAVQGAVCDKPGTVVMNLFDPQYCEWNSLGKPEMTTPEGNVVSPIGSMDVRSYTLDEFCKAEEIEKINFLKVDVEGFERAVFLGATKMLRERRIDCVCFEISQAPLKGANSSSRAVIEILEEFGYLAYRFDEADGRFHGPIHDTSEYWANFYASGMDLSKVKLPTRMGSVSTGRFEASLSK